MEETRPTEPGTLSNATLVESNATDSGAAKASPFGALSSAGVGVQERAGAAAASAGQAIDTARAGVGHLTSQAVDAASSTAAGATDLAKRTASTAAAQAQHTGIEASRTVQVSALQVKALLEAQISAYPGPALAGAAVVGFILGRLV